MRVLHVCLYVCECELMLSFYNSFPAHLSLKDRSSGYMHSRLVFIDISTDVVCFVLSPVKMVTIIILVCYKLLFFELL